MSAPVSCPWVSVITRFTVIEVSISAKRGEYTLRCAELIATDTWITGFLGVYHPITAAGETLAGSNAEAPEPRLDDACLITSILRLYIPVITVLIALIDIPIATLGMHTGV